jgi:DNA (cytosine-5)-methyltransferase 1
VRDLLCGQVIHDWATVSGPLVLSLFPGIGLLDTAFEEEGFCVVRGPDLLWGGDVHRFHPPAGKFEGVIGGPPCQFASRFRFLNPLAGKHGNLIPEFARVVTETRPAWFVMENVPDAPLPNVEGYTSRSYLLNNRWLGEEQNRTRRFSWGQRGLLLARLCIETSALESPLYAQAITSDARPTPVAIGGSGKRKRSLKPPTVHGGHGEPFDRPGMSIARMCELQGLPTDFLSEAPFTAHGKRKQIGNGVPLPMGRAIAKAVKRAMYPEQEAA